MAEFLLPANRWTRVAWTAGPFPYPVVVKYPRSSLLGPHHGPPTVSVRRISGGFPWFWQGSIPVEGSVVFWHTPVDGYASIEVHPGAFDWVRIATSP